MALKGATDGEGVSEVRGGWRVDVLEVGWTCWFCGRCFERAGMYGDPGSHDYFDNLYRFAVRHAPRTSRSRFR